MHTYIAIILTTLAVFASVANADEILLKTGEALTGKVTMQTADKLVLQINGKNRVLPRASIESITKSRISNAPKAPIKKSVAKKAASIELGPEFWPPKFNQKYPDLTLFDHRGNITTLSKVARGKVVLLEPLGMNCKACQAFSGGHKYGAFEGISPQADLKSIDEYLPKYARGVNIRHRSLVFVQLILYDMNMKAPSKEAIRDWARHYRLADRPNTYVLAGTPAMIGRESFQMIPGFHVIDKNFVFRGDGAGHRPKQDLWRQVIPSIPALLR